MEKIRKGYYIKARCIQESEISRAPYYVREIWDWLLMNANHSDNETVKRGQLIRTLQDIREGLAWFCGYRKEMYSKDQCEKAMKWLRKATMVATTKTTRGMLIEIVKYAYYQDSENYESNNESLTKATRKPLGTSTINKNVKNDKNDNKNINTNVLIAENELEINKSPDPISHLIGLFSGVNPSYKRLYANKTQRACLTRLIAEHGEQKIGRAILSLSQVSGKKYAPVITTPLDLENKLGQLLAYLKREGQQNYKFSVTKI